MYWRVNLCSRCSQTLEDSTTETDFDRNCAQIQPQEPNLYLLDAVFKQHEVFSSSLKM